MEDMKCKKCGAPLNEENVCCEGGNCCKGCCQCEDKENCTCGCKEE